MSLRAADSRTRTTRNTSKHGDGWGENSSRARSRAEASLSSQRDGETAPPSPPPLAAQPASLSSRWPGRRGSRLADRRRRGAGNAALGPAAHWIHPPSSLPVRRRSNQQLSETRYFFFFFMMKYNTLGSVKIVFPFCGGQLLNVLGKNLERSTAVLWKLFGNGFWFC